MTSVGFNSSVSPRNYSTAGTRTFFAILHRRGGGIHLGWHISFILEQILAKIIQDSRGAYSEEPVIKINGEQQKWSKILNRNDGQIYLKR